MKTRETADTPISHGGEFLQFLGAGRRDVAGRARGRRARCCSRSTTATRSRGRCRASGRRSTTTSTATTRRSTGSARRTTRTPAASAPTCATASSCAAARPTTTRTTPTSTATTRRINWNPRQCAKGYTFHRVLYGPYRLRHPIVRKGWKAWADAGFPELTPENKDEVLLRPPRRRRVHPDLVGRRVHATSPARSTRSPRRYSGEAGAKRLLAQGYQPEMVKEMGGAGTRTFKMRGGMGLLGVLGKYGMYRLNNSMALLDAKIRGVKPEEAKAGRNWSNYTWHGDQAPGHPWVHGLQASDCDFNDLRFSKLIIMDGKNLVENKLTDSHWFIECMERGGKIVVIAPGVRRRRRPRPTTGFPIRPADRRGAVPRRHAADDRQEAVRRGVRQAVHRLPAARPHRQRSSGCAPHEVFAELQDDARRRRPVDEDPGPHRRAARASSATTSCGTRRRTRPRAVTRDDVGDDDGEERASTRRSRARFQVKLADGKTVEVRDAVDALPGPPEGLRPRHGRRDHARAEGADRAARRRTSPRSSRSRSTRAKASTTGSTRPR